MIKTTKLISIYARVSTARQEEEQTIKTQIGALKEFSEKNGYTIIKEYIDDGWSGDMLARPELDKLRQDAKGKTWEAVLIYDPDRLARRYSYQELVMDELKEAGIEIIFVTIAAPKNSEDKILHGVRGLFAEYERAKITERFRLGKLRKVKEGHLLVSDALYGYKYISKQENNHGYYEVNGEEARVVKMIFNWVANDRLTLRTIVVRLQEFGVKPRRSERGLWNTSTLSHLLRNKAYIGEAHWGSSYSVVPEKPLKLEKYRKLKKTSRRMKPEEEWITIPVPSIIDKNVFEKVQIQLKDNYTFAKGNKKNEYLLAGRIYCTCGRRRTGEGPLKGKHLYYRCTDRVLCHPLPHNCFEKSINARDADNLVWSKITELMTSPELMNKQIKRWIASRQSNVQTSHTDITIIKKEINKLEEQEDRYNKAYGLGVFTIEQLKNYIDPIKEKIFSLEAQISKARMQKAQTEIKLPDKNAIERFAEKAKSKLENLNFEVKKGIVMNVVEKIIGTKENLQVYGYIPVTSNYVEPLTSDRNCRIAECR